MPRIISKSSFSFLIAFIAINAAIANADKISVGIDEGAYLFAHTTRSNCFNLFYSVSTDGLHWKILNNGNPVVNNYHGLPHIVRGNNEFYLLGSKLDKNGKTIRTAWHSRDLVSWNDSRKLKLEFPTGFRVAKDDSGQPHYGAPKAFYDVPRKRFIITWHSSTGKDSRESQKSFWQGMRTYYSITRDFNSYTKPKLLFDPGFAVIDSCIVFHKGLYVLFFKDEREKSQAPKTWKSIRAAYSLFVLGPYEDLSGSISPNWREAPTVFKNNDSKSWYLFYENYPGIAYGCVEITDLKGEWHNLQANKFSMTPEARHGNIIPVSNREYNRLLTAYGKKK